MQMIVMIMTMMAVMIIIKMEGKLAKQEQVCCNGSGVCVKCMRVFVDITNIFALRIEMD